MKLGRRRNYHKGRAAKRHYANLAFVSSSIPYSYLEHDSQPREEGDEVAPVQAGHVVGDQGAVEEPLLLALRDGGGRPAGVLQQQVPGWPTSGWFPDDCLVLISTAFTLFY